MGALLRGHFSPESVGKRSKREDAALMELEHSLLDIVDDDGTDSGSSGGGGGGGGGSSGSEPMKR